jgi:hypothetical protein
MATAIYKNSWSFKRASGHKTVYEKLLVAKRRILAAIHIRFRMIPSGNNERDLLLTARYLAGETLSALGREFGLTPQGLFQIIDSS